MESFHAASNIDREVVACNLLDIHEFIICLLSYLEIPSLALYLHIDLFFRELEEFNQ